MSLTIPAECIPQLGGMQDSDPPMLWISLGETVWDGVFAVHSSTKAPSALAHGRLLVEQSAPALLRVLARHLGWDGVGQLVVLAHLAEWRLQAYDGPHGLVWQAYLSPFLGISTDPGHLEALAAAVIWYARVARMKCGFAGSPEALTLAEQRCGAPMPTWAVQR